MLSDEVRVFTWICCANVAERIEVFLGAETSGDQRNVALDKIPDSPHGFNAAFSKLLWPRVVSCSGVRRSGAPVNWSKGRKLGTGGFGQVFLCHDRDTGRDLAVKEVTVQCSLDEASKVETWFSFHLHYDEMSAQLRGYGISVVVRLFVCLSTCCFSSLPVPQTSSDLD